MTCRWLGDLPHRPMTQVSLVSRPVVADSVPRCGGEALADSAEDPDSPVPRLPPVPPAAVPAPSERALPAGFERLSDPLAEPMAALLGTILALLTLAVPVLAVLGEARADATNRSDGLERIDDRATPGGTARP